MRRAAALICLAGLLVVPAGAQGFAFKAEEEGFAVSAVANGQAATLAGSHPHSIIYSLGFTEGDLRDLNLQMPAGLLENPTAVPKCKASEFNTHRASPYEVSQSGESCRAEDQVGVVEIEAEGGETRSFGLFNLVPPEGVPSEVGFAPYGEHVAFDSRVSSTEGAYAFSLSATDIPQSLEAEALTLTIWGVPWSASHDSERGNCLNEAEPSFGWAKCSVGAPADEFPFAYLTLPTSCKGALSFTAVADAWSGGGQVSAQASNRDSQGNLGLQQGCNTLVFEPQPLGFLTDKKASSASGYNFRLKVDYEGLLLPRRRAPSQTEEATVSLPGGTTINPSVGAGLEACTPAQYASETDHWSAASGCPSTAKIGDFSLHSPLYAEWIAGGIYLAQPHQNPFGSLIAVYLVAKSPERGILVKLAGQIKPDPGTGDLTATFPQLPQLPYTDLELDFRSGQRAPLVTPAACGTARSQITLAPWSPGVADLGVASDSQIETGIEGGPCPSGIPPFQPTAVAGGVNSNVGSYTPYYVHLSRKDTEQEITSYSLVLPRGITGKLAGIPYCSEAQIAAARANSGFAETANPSCPTASQVGRTFTGYGVGSALTYAPGRIYLAGPYHGAPLSLVTINSATVGPFDLGTIVIRSAFRVDPLTAQLRIDAGASDPIPHIIDGIPLHLREIRIYVDRFEFTHNPTSCEPSALESTLTGSAPPFTNPVQTSATTGVHFQLLNCLTLGYAPHLGLKIAGGTKRGAFPSLQATMQAHKGDADLKQITVTMPHSEFLAQQHIRTICTQAQFQAEACPPGSVYGSAAAFTPLFSEPLKGPVYLRSSQGKLPDLVASLHSGTVHIVLDGRISSAHGGMRASFFDLPDAPLYRFVMKLYGGKRGLITNSSNICAAPPVATVAAIAQNNRGASFRSLLHSPSCGKKAKKGKRHQHRHHVHGRTGR